MITTQVFHQPPPGFSPIVDISAIHVIVHDHLLLVQLSSIKAEKGFWGMPAGKVNTNETPLEAAKRELFEETGIKADPSPIGILYIRKPNLDYHYHMFNLCLSEKPPIVLSAEHCSHQWITRHHLKDFKLMSGGAEVLTAYFERSTTVAIGSKNPIKVKAVENGIGKDFNVIPCEAISNVRHQPLSEEETLQGAIYRAKDSLKKTIASLGIGLEAGISIKNGIVYLCHWGAIVDREGRIYNTNGPQLMLPDEFLDPLQNGESLEDIMHRTTGIHKLGQKAGAIGIFTQNRLDREQVLTYMVKALMGQYLYFSR